MLKPRPPEHVREKIFKTVHWYGFEDLVIKQESYHPSITKLLCAINYDFSYPLFVYYSLGSIPELESIKHSNIEQLNTVGIHVYLHEHMYLYIKDNQLRSLELDSIVRYIENNKLTNVTVHTCEYRCEELFSYYMPYMKLLTDDIYVKSVTSKDITLPTDKFNKHFINLNWRYSEHRHLTAAFVYPLDSYCSWKYVIDNSESNWSNVNELDSIFDNRISTGFKKLNDDAPLKIDLSTSKITITDLQKEHETNRPLNVFNTDPEMYYADIFCDVVTETQYAQLPGNISEKTLRPINYMKPFILVAPPRSLEYLRTFGYKTFSDYWDESYDLILDHQQRLISVFKLIDHIQSKSITELRQLYNQMLPILKHNFELLNQLNPNLTRQQRVLKCNTKLKNFIWEAETDSELNKS